MQIALQLVFILEVMIISYIIYHVKGAIYRPSVLFCLAFMVRISFSAAFYDYLEGFYNPIEHSFDLALFQLISILFPFVCIIIVLSINLSISSTKPIMINSYEYFYDFSYKLPTIRLLSLVFFFVLVISLNLLLNEVPFDKTGLYATFFDPQNAVNARENTLKLLTNRFTQLLYGFCRNYIVYISAGLAFLLYYFSNIKRDKYIAFFIILFLLFFVSISGAKGPVAWLLIYLGLLNLLVKGGNKKFFKLIFICFFAFLVIVLFKYLLLIDKGYSLTYTFQTMLHRALVAPFETGLWHYEYALNHGFWGISAIAIPLKTHLGIDSSLSYAIVGAWKSSIIGGPESNWMNTSVLFTHISNWGYFFGIFLSVLLVVIFDLLLFFEKNIPNFFVYVIRPVFYINAVSLVSTDFFSIFWNTLYFIVLLSIIFVFLGLLHFPKKNIRIS